VIGSENVVLRRRKRFTKLKSRWVSLELCQKKGGTAAYLWKIHFPISSLYPFAYRIITHPYSINVQWNVQRKEEYFAGRKTARFQQFSPPSGHSTSATTETVGETAFICYTETPSVD
jgi:hypothetical protein